MREVKNGEEPAQEKIASRGKEGREKQRSLMFSVKEVTGNESFQRGADSEMPQRLCGN